MRTPAAAAAAAAILALFLASSVAIVKVDLDVVPELGNYVLCWSYVAEPHIINELIDYTVDGTFPGKKTCEALNQAANNGFCIPDMFLIWQEKYGYNRDLFNALGAHCQKSAQ